MEFPVCLMFSGQGSQYHQMGRELYDRHARFRLWMDYCDQIASDCAGLSITGRLYGSRTRAEPLDELRYAAPALVAVQYSLARVLGEAGIEADQVVGYSLGELTGAVVAGALSIDNAIGFAIRHAAVLERETAPAGMLAVMAGVGLVDEFEDAFADVDVTAENFDGSFVVTGPETAIDRVEARLGAERVPSQRLPVRFGFHTAMIEPAKESLGRLIEGLPLARPRIPLVSSRTGGFVEVPDAEHYWEVARQPIFFPRAIETLERSGPRIYLDVGPAGTLATFVKYLLRRESPSQYFECMNPFGRDEAALRRAIDAIRPTTPDARPIAGARP